ncbi:DUF2553 family protein [Mangrovibacillus cuniculi]|uniref:YusG family protein n=1 Tax=Mangrovibacillus cuniculi TaxID=2593652 RepID=A0A7S8HGC6_9BACI|nr:DUF2553 family protein [Mangrovibacillus cuniculi]QPC47406.1 YusG family protein [Mangrovibacillus cuniculi]
MTLNPKKLNVTERLTAKVQHNELVFMLDGEKVGAAKLEDVFGANFHSEPNFELNAQQIYQYYTETTGQDARYTDCDEGGWC